MKNRFATYLWRLLVCTALLGSAVVASARTSEAAGVCVECMMRANAGQTPLSGQAGFQQMMLQFPNDKGPVTQPMEPGQSFKSNWTPGGGMPGGFQAPWSNSFDTGNQFDPTFQVNPEQLPAFWNNPSAPYVPSAPTFSDPMLFNPMQFSNPMPMWT